MLGVLAGLAWTYLKHPFGCSVVLVLGVIVVLGVIWQMLQSVQGALILIAVLTIWTGMSLLFRGPS